MAATMSLTSSLTQRASVATRPLAARRVAVARPTRQVTRALSDTNLIISGSTAAMLALGRFAFLPYHRASLAKAGLPVQNGMTHAAAGDRLAEEASFVLKTNDPAGFTLVDVMGWGALGHVLGYFLLAAASNGYSGPANLLS